MEPEKYYKNINHVVHISTDVVTGCDHCSFAINGDNFAESVNHYIKEHSYKLLHVGTETRNNDGKLWHSSVAILGK